jgi:hypothetical protein
MLVRFILRQGDSFPGCAREISFGGRGAKSCQDTKRSAIEAGHQVGAPEQSDVQIDGGETAVLLMDNRCSG